MASSSRRPRQRKPIFERSISPPQRGPLGNLWKEAFPVGTEQRGNIYQVSLERTSRYLHTMWDQYDRVYEINWDFSNLEQAFEEGGILHGKRVYLFGCTEPQLVWFKEQDMSRVVHIPAVVAVLSPFPPSDKVGIKSVQMEGEMIVPMKTMKMDWVPYIPKDLLEHTSVERYKAQIFTLKCTQRKAALKQLRVERIKKYEYCLPYLYQPMREEQVQDDTVVQIMYSFEDPNKPPVVTEFDWQFDEYEEYTDELINGEQLPAEEKKKFMDHVKGLVGAEKQKNRQAREARQKSIQDMSPEIKEAIANMKFYKFYPVKSLDAPDISNQKAAFINRYYGKATEVF